MFKIFICGIFVLCAQMAFCEITKEFTLKSTQSLITGPSDGKMITYEGSRFSVTCKVKNDRINMKNIDSDSGKIISEDEYEFIIENNMGIASSPSGNVKHLFDFDRNEFYAGQANVLLDRVCVLTKNTIGVIINRK